MKSKILRNWPLKLLSLLMAFAIWFAVVTATDPQTTKNFEIPIEFENEELISSRGQSVEIVGDTTLTIRVTKNRSVINSLSAADFRAVADFSAMYQDTQVPVKVTSLNEQVYMTDIEQENSSVEVRLDPIETVSRAIEVEITGAPASGCTVGEVTISPESAVITGPSEFVALIKRAVVHIDVSGASENFETTANLELYDGNGTLLQVENTKDAKLESGSVPNCSVQMLIIQNVPVTVSIRDTDQVADGFRFLGASCDPGEFMLAGPKALLAPYQAIRIGDISAKGINTSVEKEVDIRSYLPDGITVYGGEPTTTLKIEVAELSQQVFNIPADDIKLLNVPDGMTCTVSESRVGITVSALYDELAQLSGADMTVSADLSGMEAGEHQVLLNVEFPEGEYRQIGTEQITVTLTKTETGSE